jgi:acyl-ACP thioesterase
MAPVPKLINKYRVMVNDTDFTRKLKLSAAFNYFQEIAAMHADNLGLGIDTIVKNHGVVWVLMRIRLDIVRYPLWDEEITLETWPQAPKKLEFERNYIMKDKKGDVIARAISVWVMMDMETRRLKKPEISTDNYPAFIAEKAIDCTLGKLKPLSEPVTAYKRLIGCSDIDMNGHLNNSKYIDFIMDCFSMEQLKRYEAKSLQVNYVNEVFPGDTIVLRKDASASDSGMIYVEGVNDKDGSAIFKALIETREA